MTITNTATYDLLLPLLLTLDPARAADGGVRDADGLLPDGRWLIRLDDNVSGGVRLRPGETTTAQTASSSAARVVRDIVTSP